jgi:hypothetical protein
VHAALELHAAFRRRGIASRVREQRLVVRIDDAQARRRRPAPEPKNPTGTTYASNPAGSSAADATSLTSTPSTASPRCGVVSVTESPARASARASSYGRTPDPGVRRPAAGSGTVDWTSTRVIGGMIASAPATAACCAASRCAGTARRLSNTNVRVRWLVMFELVCGA